MRFLANENVPLLVVEALKKRGHDVLWGRTGMPGSSDREVLRRAQTENRIVLTFDKGLGELAFRQRLAASRGVILLRVLRANPTQLAEMVAETLSARTDWGGHFSVIEQDRIRMVPLTR